MSEAITMDLYETPTEAHVHDDAIESLAAETRMSPAFVRSVYERELIRLKPHARVKDFLVLFAVRKAREALRSERRQ